MMFLRDPGAYHGEKNKRPFFEGWYHKLVTDDGQSLAIIPGIYRSGFNNNQTAFIMILLVVEAILKKTGAATFLKPGSGHNQIIFRIII